MGSKLKKLSISDMPMNASTESFMNASSETSMIAFMFSQTYFQGVP